MAKRELIPSKQEKAYERIKSFRADLLDYRQSFDRLKKDREETVRNLAPPPGLPQQPLSTPNRTPPSPPPILKHH